MLESKIQRQIVIKLESAGWLVNKILTCSKNGWPDLEAFRVFPEMVHIEVKQPGKHPKPLQEYRHQELKNRGFRVIIATSLNDINHLL